MGMISGLLKYKAIKKGVKVVKEVFSSKAMPVKRTSSMKRKPALRKAAARA
jgi:hypothetical protein